MKEEKNEKQNMTVALWSGDIPSSWMLCVFPCSISGKAITQVENLGAEL